jgi:hypothetical protein
MFDELYQKLGQKLNDKRNYNVNVIESIFPFIMGISIQCNETITKSLKTMFALDEDIIEGIVTIISKDSGETSSVNQLAQKMNLNPELTVNLFELISK